MKIVCNNEGMRGIKILLGLLLSVGVLIAVFSLYQISLSGTMKKMGLEGADFANMISVDKLTNAGMAAKGELECGFGNRVKSSVEFLLAGDSKQGQLSFRLGERRIICGAGMMRSGKGETGTYEVMKGLGYLKTGYGYVVERGSVDTRACENLFDRNVEEVMVELISSTNGRVYELLYKEWLEVIQLQEQVDEMCLDGRESRR